jgi:hypothetical protein
MGVEKLYVLYGNSTVKAKSSANDTYRLFDDFEGTTLSDIWIFSDGGYNGNTYTIDNSVIRLSTYSKTYPISLRSKDFFYNCLVEYNFRMIPGTYNYTTDLDWQVGFEGKTFAYIGCASVENDEYPHYLSSASSQGIINGTKFASYSFKIHTVVESLYYQMSNYDGETLVSSGILTTLTYSPIIFAYNNDFWQPKIEIDWIRIRSYDPSPPTYIISRGQSINDLFNAAELHTVYNGGDDYLYASKQNSLVRSSYISDICITEGTSRHIYGNVIFLATPWGAVVIEEKRGDETNSTKRIYLISS